MTATFRRALIVWLVLLTLSAVSFATRMESPRTAAAVVLTLALAKSLLLLWHFMELRRAHALWRISMLVLACSLAATVFLAGW